MTKALDTQAKQRPWMSRPRPEILVYRQRPNTTAEDMKNDICPATAHASDSTRSADHCAHYKFFY